MIGSDGMRGRFGKMRMSWWLENHILLLIAEKPSHGYDIVSRLRNMGFSLPGMGNMGTVYRLLNLLEMQGYIESRWELGDQGPARKVYWLTSKGWLRLMNIAMSMESLKKEIDDFLVRFEKLKKKREGEDDEFGESFENMGSEI